MKQMPAIIFCNFYREIEACCGWHEIPFWRVTDCS